VVGAVDDVVVDVTTAALAVEAVLSVEVTVVPLHGQEVTVTVVVVSLSVEVEAAGEAVTEAEDEVEVEEVTPCADEVVDAATLLDKGGVPKPPETVGNGEAELPTAEQMALPAVLLDSMQIAPNCG
jgi:hypothetical protein